MDSVNLKIHQLRLTSLRNRKRYNEVKFISLNIRTYAYQESEKERREWCLKNLKN